MKVIDTINSQVSIGLLEESSFSNLIANYNNIVILVDENTKVGLTKIKSIIDDRILNIIEIKSGEAEKNLKTCEFVWSQLLQYKIKRNDLLINLGGGVICDLGGFAASTFKRGIDFINIPTSLLSMIDASVGGKTGINFNHLKNNIGLFKEAKHVFCDVTFLETLPKRELIAGIGEILKHSLIANKDYWQTLVSIPYNQWNWNDIIVQSITIKNNIVVIDPFEKAERKKLNFGHTIGHAIESLALQEGEILLHGEAVAIGIICECYISFKKGLLDINELEEISNLVLSIFKNHNISNNKAALIELMQQDKKNEEDSINFTLLSGIGNAIINQKVENHLILDSIDYYRTKSNA